MSYCSLVLFVVLVLINQAKDMKIFMRLSSFGVVFSIMLLVFIIGTGIFAFTDTNFSLGTMEQSDATIWAQDERTLVLANRNFPPLLGILCTGYFLHTVSMDIIRKSKTPEKAGRDMFWGYFLTFISYCIVGTLGYIGFMGT